MKEGMPITILLAFAVFTLGILLLIKKDEIKILKAQHVKPTIVYMDDCYIGEDFKHDIVSAKQTEKLLKELTKRKLR